MTRGCHTMASRGERVPVEQKMIEQSNRGHDNAFNIRSSSRQRTQDGSPSQSQSSSSHPANRSSASPPVAQAIEGSIRPPSSSYSSNQAPLTQAENSSSSAAEYVAEARLSAAVSFVSSRDRSSFASSHDQKQQQAAAYVRKRAPLSPIGLNGNMSEQLDPASAVPVLRKRHENGGEPNLAKPTIKNERNVSFSPSPKRQYQRKVTVQSTKSKNNFEVIELDSIHDDDTQDRESLGSSKEEEYDAPTVLHELCHSAKCIKDLHSIKSLFQNKSSLTKDISSASMKKDVHGRFPLHILSENTKLSESIASDRTKKEEDNFSFDNLEALSSSSFGQHDTHHMALTTFVADLLLPANPTAVSVPDAAGYIPFQRAIKDWVEQVHEPSSIRKLRISPNRRMSTAVAADTIQNAWLSTTENVSAAIDWAGKSLKINRSWRSFPSRTGQLHDDFIFEEASPRKIHSINVMESDEFIDADDDTYMDTVARFSSQQTEDMENGVFLPSEDDTQRNTAADVRESKHEDVTSSERSRRNRVFPQGVRLTPHAVFALKQLSAIMDQLNGKKTSHFFRQKSVIRQLDQEDDESHPEIEIEYCHDAEEISNEVIRHIGSIPDFVKTLLLLEADSEFHWAFSCSIVKHVIVDKSSVGNWLTCMIQSPNKVVSKRAVQYLHLVSELLGKDGRHEKRQEELYDEVSRLEGLIPSMLTLNERSIEDVATTPIVKRVLDMMISRPFAVSVVFFDALFLLVLIVAFRVSVVGFLTTHDPSSVLKWIYVANAGIFYFIIREIGKAISLCMITRHVRVYLLSFWNLTDILATVMALSSTIAMRVNFTSEDLDLDNLQFLRGCLAVTTGLLWLRVLSLLKTINCQLATFVLAIIQITRDILWFLIILVTMIVSYAQMFYTLLIPSSCASKDASEDVQCSPSEYYLKVYTILLGDFGLFDRDNFKTFFSVLLIVIFTFMVVVVLLNVLIAIVSDSYEKCLIRSQNLFGRARVMLLAELVSFQDLLRRNTTTDSSSSNAEGGNDMLDMSTVYSQWWTGDLSKNYGWSRGSIMFFTLSSGVVLIWIFGETVGYLSGERYGNYVFSFGSILVNILVFVAILKFLSESNTTPTATATATAEADDINTALAAAHDDDTQGIQAWGKKIPIYISHGYRHFIQKNLLRLLGSSSKVHKRNSSRTNATVGADMSPTTWGGVNGMLGIKAGSTGSGGGSGEDFDYEWRGRVVHMQREMARLADESVLQTQEHIQLLEQHVHLSESHLRGEMRVLETRMKEFQSEFVEELHKSEQRTEQMIRDTMMAVMDDLKKKC